MIMTMMITLRHLYCLLTGTVVKGSKSMKKAAHDTAKEKECFCGVLLQVGLLLVSSTTDNNRTILLSKLVQPKVILGRMCDFLLVTTS